MAEGMAEVTWELLRLPTGSQATRAGCRVGFPAKISQKKAYSVYSDYTVFRSFCLFCYREQNERNDIPFIPKTE